MSARPFLRWAGSKTKLLAKLEKFWSPEYSRYIEPFMGSATLFFHVCPARALLSDMNAELVHAFMVVKYRPDELHDELVSLPIGKEEYYRIRSLNPADLSELKRAARFIYLNRFCFNGIYRTNMRGEFNVPYSASKTGAIPSLEQIRSASKSLSSAELINGDFEDILLENAQKGDFVYLDPPYAVANRRIFRQYGPDTFGLDDLARLSALLEELDNRGVKFLLSYALSREALETFKNWNCTRVKTQRNVAGFSRHRRTAIEVMASNVDA